mmetsp:Transcript_22200/g.36786  ORF Transcript_22200/g.36786 Transcript_22200/m.36786 type:complete len:124 (-) Transcript_22200:352-723(-)
MAGKDLNTTQSITLWRQHVSKEILCQKNWQEYYGTGEAKTERDSMPHVPKSVQPSNLKRVPPIPDFDELLRRKLDSRTPREKFPTAPVTTSHTYGWMQDSIVTKLDSTLIGPRTTPRMITRPK